MSGVARREWAETQSTPALLSLLRGPESDALDEGELLAIALTIGYRLEMELRRAEVAALLADVTELIAHASNV